MPLTSIKQELLRARQGGYAIPLFDTYDMNSTEGMFAAIEEKRAPVIAAIYSTWMDFPWIPAYTAYIRARAEKSPVPVTLYLDHGADFEQCMRAISLGFTDIMYDGSKLPVEENINNTKEIVRVAHAMGISVEAELGHVGQGSEYQDFAAQRKGFTDPELAARFVEETGVDFLAVAIGTAHGVYQGTPQLDLDLLAQIRAAVDVPLVLHGGSGLSEEQFRAAIKTGISKVNVATDLYRTTGRRLVEAAQRDDGINYQGLMKAAMDSFQERCGYYLDLFGATGKAPCAEF